MTTSIASTVIDAPPDMVFDAFTDPVLLVKWQAPDNMTARIHRHDIRAGGSYEMSLFYDDPHAAGKSGGNEDRYTATFVTFDPPRRIVESIVFAFERASGATPMTMTVDLEPVGAGTRVTLTFANLPDGVSPADNDEGTRQSFAKLARLLTPTAL
jgi:uncharacterized protein YndB with AHSA1/START domain